jgi:hypothetical protein
MTVGIVMGLLSVSGMSDGLSQLINHAAAASIDTTYPRLAFESLRRLPNDAFRGGEYLRFSVKFGVISAGEAEIQVRDTVYHGRRSAHIIDFFLKSKPFFDAFYKVRDRYRTIIDAEGLFPWRFEQRVREGSYVREFDAEFDQLRHVATTSEGTYSIPPYVHDMMSAFYFARTVDYTNFTAGERIHLQNFYKDSTYQLDVRYRGKQVIQVDAGTFKCIVIEPLVREGGLFKSDGKIFIWITDDDRKLPVRVSTRVPIGTIESELVEYQGLSGPVQARIGR